MAKLRELKKITNIFETFDRNATLALYEVARLITISGEPRTIVEDLILRAEIVLCKIMLNKSAAKLVSSVFFDKKYYLKKDY